MKKLSDKEIQEMLDAQSQDFSAESESDEFRSYSLLYQALEQPLDDGLALDFAEKVSQKAVQQSLSRQIRKYWLMVVACIVFTLSLCALSLYIFELSSILKMMSWLGEARWGVLFAIFMFALIQLADHRLVSKKQYSAKS